MTTTIRDDDLSALSDLFVASGDRPAHLSPLTPDTLAAFARVLLVTDGTVTHMLRAHFREPIHVEVLEQNPSRLETELPWLEAKPGDDILIRKVALKGAKSQNCYCRATSWIALDRLPQEMKTDIIELRRSIGNVLLANFSENRRELLWYGQGQAAADDFPQAQNLNQNRAAEPQKTLERAYRVISGGHPLMIISETFAPLILAHSEDPIA